ncbi:MAG: BCCT family transporter [Cyclobacteriaceae bacterium]
MQRLNPIKFWPPIILLIATVVYSLIDKVGFLEMANIANAWVLENFSWLFSWSVLGFVLLIAAIYFSPFGKIVLGGSSAVSLLSKWKWFSITLCTTIATGILFWGTAEPLFHFNNPPASLGIEPAGSAAKIFSMSTMLLHWTISPYAIYTLAALTFSYCFYNLKQPFEVSSTLFPLIGNKSKGYVGHFVDIICLYGLVAGMAAALGAGILTIAGGLNTSFGIAQNSFILGLIAVAIVTAFVASASSGLLKGIRILSDYNMKAFILLALFFLIFGPTSFIIKTSITSLGSFVTNFFPRSINWNDTFDQGWFQSWTIFNWANWLAWTPITALFLGRLGQGYSVRTFIRMNLLYPSIFGAVWMSIFSGSSIFYDIESKGKLFKSLGDIGPESVIYQIFSELPMSEVTGGFFLIITFISYVTAADSNTSAMSNLCTKGISTENQESPLFIQIIWGSIIGILAWVMISYAGIDGIKMISVLGGFPALFLVILIAFGAVKLLLSERKHS